MKRKKSLKRIERDQPILALIRDIKVDHPFWGHRRIWAYLRFHYDLKIGKNRVYRLMREHGLLVKQNLRLIAKRAAYKPKPKATRPNQFWGIDMTKIKLKDFGWLYLHVVLDWYTKEIVGYSLSLQSKSSDWLLALDKAVNNRFPQGAATKTEELFLISDNGCQPTSEKFMSACRTLGIKQIFTSWNNPKGNADTERVMRTIKEDLVWPKDWDNPFAFEAAFAHWVDCYNHAFPHQSLAYTTPALFFKSYLETLPKVANSLYFLA